MNYCEKCMQPLNEGAFCPACGILTAAPLHHIRPGTILRKKYLVGRAIREEAMVISYLCRDLSCDQVVILQEFFPEGQVIRNHLQSNAVAEAYFQEKTMERFLEKADVLSHYGENPRIQQVRDFFRDNNTAYMVTERPTGITIKRYLEKKGTIPAAALLQLMEPTLQLLDELHGKGVLHRRLSPETIMIYPNGTVKLVDFGMPSVAVDLTNSYISPEQCEDVSLCGPWSDVYALCATLYKSITGQDPQPAKDRLQDDTLLPPSALGIAMQEDTEAALMMGLALDKEKRLMSIRALMRAMQMALPAVSEEFVALRREKETVVFTGMPVLEEASEQEEKLIDPVENHGKMPTYTAPMAEFKPEPEEITEPEPVPETEPMPEPEFISIPEPMPEFEEVSTPLFEPAPQETEFGADAATQIFTPQPDAWQPEQEWQFPVEQPQTEKQRNGKKVGLIATICVLAAVLVGLVGLFFYLRQEKGLFGGKENAGQTESLSVTTSYCEGEKILLAVRNHFNQ